MKFKDALVTEAVTHTDREKVPLEQKKIILKDVLNKIQNGQFKINLRNSRVSDIEYIARQLKNEYYREWTQLPSFHYLWWYPLAVIRLIKASYLVI